jgi:hypothetical protein
MGARVDRGRCVSGLARRRDHVDEARVFVCFVFGRPRVGRRAAVDDERAFWVERVARRAVFGAARAVFGVARAGRRAGFDGASPAGFALARAPALAREAAGRAARFGLDGDAARRASFARRRGVAVSSPVLTSIVSRPTSLLKLLFCPRLVVSWKMSASFDSSNRANHSSQEMGWSRSSPV